MPAASAPIRRLATAALTLVAAVTLTACVENPPQLPEAPSTPSSPSSTPTAGPSPTAAPPSGPEPVDAACDELITADTMYAFDPNFALLDDWAPDAGSAAAEALAVDGVACRWVRESGGISIDLSVARLPEAQLDARKNEAFAESQMVPTYGDEAYFEVAEGRGEAIVFQDDVWLVIASEWFAEPGEATDLVESALAVLAD
jgi:hypothetical protein